MSRACSSRNPVRESRGAMPSRTCRCGITCVCPAHPIRSSRVTSEARRGRRIFFTLATMMVADQIGIVVLAVSRGLDSAHWWRTIAQPLCLALGVVLLWHGENWLRWLVAIACLTSGAAKVAVSGYLAYRFLAVTPRDQIGLFFQTVGRTLLTVGLGGFAYRDAGMGLLPGPSLRAFFPHQRPPAFFRDSTGGGLTVTIVRDDMPDGEEPPRRPRCVE